MRYTEPASIALAAWTACIYSGAASAIPTNPIDPSLPLDVYTRVRCIQNIGSPPLVALSHCFGARVVENPVTLTNVVGNGEARADLPTGTLRSHSVGRAIWFGADQIRAGGSAEANFYDTITFLGSYVGPVEIRMTFAGDFFTTDANPNVQGSEVRGFLMVLRDDNGFFVAANGLTIAQDNSGEVYMPDSTHLDQTNANPVTGLFDPADVQFYVSVVFPVTAADRTFAFRADLETTATLGFTNPVDVVKEASVNFGDGGQLEVIAPAGVGWTSGSGLLLPEPGASVSLLTGLSGLAWLAQRRNAERRP